MPQAALRPCPKPGCRSLTQGGPCFQHRQQRNRELDARRGTRTQRGYTNRWLRAVSLWLAEDPLRQFCTDPHKRHGRRLVMGTQTDHIIPHRGNQQLFWDRNNWQRLCDGCHGLKTLKERE